MTHSFLTWDFFVLLRAAHIYVLARGSNTPRPGITFSKYLLERFEFVHDMLL